MSNYSIVEYFAEHEGYRCGYCKSPNTNYSHGMWAHSLTASDYQDLIDRGWRRSGKYCYKPTMAVTCCPMYTIRCNALSFKLSKSQKKILKRMKKFLIHGRKEEKDSAKEAGDEDSSQKEFCDFTDNSLVEQMSERMHPHLNIQNIKRESEESTIFEKSKDVKAENMEAFSTNLQIPSKVAGPDPTKPHCKKAKLLRRERKLQRLLKKGASPSGQESNKEVSERKKMAPQPKVLEDFLADPVVENPAHKLEEEECELPCGYGSFHQQYWLDGKLIAVGVIDILPHSVSSVYLYYDPEYSFLSLGTYAALREVAFVRELNRFSPELKYYYMGFYIHSCLKMRYKAHLQPSYLLCPETYTWHPYDKCKMKLDVAKYERFEEDSNKVDKDGITDEDGILVLHSRKIMTYSMYRRMSGRSDNDEVQQYAGFVGRRCYRRMLLYRN